MHTGAAEKGNASKVVNRVNKKEEEEKQRRASESYVNFGPTTNECDSKAGQEGRGHPAKQKTTGVQSQLLGGDLVSGSLGCTVSSFLWVHACRLKLGLGLGLQ